MKRRLLIYIHYLEIGGAERALIGLLDALDPERLDIDLLINQHTGEFLSMVPSYVNILPEIPEYSTIERPLKDIVREGHISMALRRLWAKHRHRMYIKSLDSIPVADESILHYVFQAVEPALRDLSYLGEYDLAISFLGPHQIVLNKVKARKKICWIHTDYSKVHINASAELPVWAAYDKIVSISPDVTEAFTAIFPSLRPKIIEIENILSPEVVRSQSDAADVSGEMPAYEGGVNILSIGRFSVAKRFEEVPRMCRILRDKGLRFKWYIIGYGPDTQIHRNIDRYDVGDTLILLGKKSNPYPYIRSCDIYVQPSLFEGKSVTVREAQILGRPPIITSYPTAISQVSHGVDGMILPLDIEGCAQGIFDILNDKHKLDIIHTNLLTMDFANRDEVDKIYDLLQDDI